MKNNEPQNHSQLQITLQSEVVGSVRVLRDKSLTLGFAESCTGGLLSSYLTELAGVSDVFTGSIISYDNSVKQKFLKVSEDTLKSKGAVSRETAVQMAEAAWQELGCAVAVSVTGIAGPSGGTPDKPVGTVFVGLAGAGYETQVFQHQFSGDRKSVQLQTCIAALRHLNEFINR